MDLSGLIPPGYTLQTMILIGGILGVSGLMSGLSGFGFSAVGAVSLWFMPPTLGVPLLISLSTVTQVMSLGQLKAELRPWGEWWPDGPTPYLLGGCLGVPFGLAILHTLPTATLLLVVGALLVIYAAYSMLKPAGLHVSVKGNPLTSGAVGMAGGLVGGFTAFPGAAVVVWSGLRQMPKGESRAIVQPYILGLQLIALTLLGFQHPETFSRTFWLILMITVPVVLTGTLLGVNLYRSLSDLHFRRVTFLLLGASGLGLLVKGIAAFHLKL